MLVRINMLHILSEANQYITITTITHHHHPFGRGWGRDASIETIYIPNIWLKQKRKGEKSISFVPVTDCIAIRQQKSSDNFSLCTEVTLKRSKDRCTAGDLSQLLRTLVFKMKYYAFIIIFLKTTTSKIF